MKTYWNGLNCLLGLMLLNLCLSPQLVAQKTTAKELNAQIDTVGILASGGKLEEALEMISKLSRKTDLNRFQKEDVRLAHINTLKKLASRARYKQDWKTAKKFSEESLALLNISTTSSSESYQEHLNKLRWWTIKNMVVACHGLGDLEQAKRFREKLHKAYREEKLPKGLNKFFNFEFFRQENKNVWGYEYFSNLSESEIEGGHSKFVYHIYTAEKDGTDKDQLYLLHLVKMHKLAKEDNEMYVLTLRWQTDDGEGSNSLFKYLYPVPVDMKKLSKDIRKVIGQIQVAKKGDENEDDDGKSDDNKDSGNNRG